MSINKRLVSRRDGSERRCIVYRKTEPKTFSNFVDKVIDEFPGTVSSRSVPALLRDSNNPYEVLRSKGLLDISRDSARIGDGSNVTLNFYTEESRDGETVRSFSSNHHFKDGRLVFSSTQELLPHKQPHLEYTVRKEIKERRSISSGRGDLRTKSDITCKESVKKKLSDMLNDIRRRKIVEYYEKAARKRQQRFPLNYAADARGTRNTNEEIYLSSLRSVNAGKQDRSFTLHQNRKASPGRVKYLVSYKQTPSDKYTEKFKCRRSSSEISVSSIESSAYSSPGRTVKRSSKRHECYRTVVLSPKPKFRKDLFVIPKHTCRDIPDVPRYKTFTASHQWHSVKDFGRSPKHGVCRNTADLSSSSEYDSEIERNDNGRRTSCLSREQLEDHFSLLKGFRHRKVHPEGNGLEDVKNRRIGHPIRQKGNRDDLSHGRGDVKSKRKQSTKEFFSETKPVKFKHGIRDELPAGEPFIRSATDYETFRTANRGETSFSSTETLPFPSTSDSESQQGYKKKSFKNCEAPTKRETGTQISSGDSDTVNESSSKKEHTPKRRHINPNKIVHFEDTGKRLSQYYTSGKATIDSDKAFEDEQKARTKKITININSPKSSISRELENDDQQHGKVVYREESLEDYVKQAMFEDRKEHLDVAQNTGKEETLKEYREKYVTSSVKEKTSTDKSGGKEYHQCEVSVSRSESHSPDVCEACEIESLNNEK